MDRATEEEGWPECTYLSDNRIAIKLAFDSPVFVTYFDHRLDTEPPIILNHLWNAIFIRSFLTSKLISYKYATPEVFLTCLDTYKNKALLFSGQTTIDDIQVLHAQRIAIARYKNSIEILDICKNRILEQVLFLNCTNLRMSIEAREDSGRFLCYYNVGDQLRNNSKLVVKIWRIHEDKTIQSSGEVRLLDTPKEAVVEFIDKDHLMVMDRDSTLGIYRIDQKGVIKINQFEIPMDPGYASVFEKPKRRTTEDQYHYSCLKVLDDRYFIALRVWTIDLDADKQSLLLFNYAIRQGAQRQLELYPTRLTLDNDENQYLRDIQALNVEPLIEHISDKIVGITHRKDDYIFFLTQSRKLMCYEMKTGAITTILRLAGVDSNKYNFKAIRCIGRYDIAILFTDSQDSYQILVYDYDDKDIFFDSKEAVEQGTLIKECTISNNRIFIEYCKTNDGVELWYAAELDYIDKAIKNIAFLMDEEVMMRLQATPKGILMGLSQFNVDTFHEPQRVLFFSVEEKEMLYEIDVQDLIPDIANRVMVTDLLSIGDDLAVLLVKHELQDEKDSKIVVWSITKKCVVGQYSAKEISHLLGRIKSQLLFLDETTTAESMGDIDLKEVLGMTLEQIEMRKEEPLDLTGGLWKKYIPEIERNGFEWLSKLKSVAAYYDKKVFPNSLLLLRKRNMRLECLRFMNKKLKENYHPYAMKDIVETIFGGLQEHKRPAVQRILKEKQSDVVKDKENLDPNGR